MIPGKRPLTLLNECFVLNATVELRPQSTGRLSRIFCSAFWRIDHHAAIGKDDDERRPAMGVSTQSPELDIWVW